MILSKPETRIKLTALVVFAVAAFIQTYPLGLHPARGIVDTQDGLLNTWILAWDQHQLFRHPFALFQANVFYPNSGTLAYSEHLLPQAVISLPVALLSSNPILAYNFVFYLCCLLNAYAMFLLVRHLTRDAAAGIVAGLIFGFATTMLQQISHLQLMSAWFIPLGFLALHRFFETRRLKHSIFFALCLTLQSLACIYYGLFFFSVLVVALPLLVWLNAGTIDRSFWRRFLPPLAVGGAIMFLFSLPYLRLFRRFAFERPLAKGAELQNYLAVQTHNNFLAWALHRLGSNEYFLFPGIIALGLAAYFLARHRGPRSLPRAVSLGFAAVAALSGLALIVILVSGGTGLKVGSVSATARNPSRPAFGLLLVLAVWFAASTVMFLLKRRSDAPDAEKSARLYLLVLGWALFLSFGSGFTFLGTTPFNQRFHGDLFSPFHWFYDYVPGFKGIRMPSRYAIFVLFAAAVLAGWGWKALSERLKPGRTRIAAVALVALLLNAEFLSVPQRLNLIPVGSEVPPTYTWLKERPAGSPVLELPLMSWIPDEAIYMYFALTHGQPLVNGYSGFIPDSTEYLRVLFGNFPSWGTVDILQKLGVRYVVVHAKAYPPGKLRNVLKLAGKRFASALRLTQVFRYDFAKPNALEAGLGEDYVFEVAPAAEVKRAVRDSVEVPRESWTVVSNERPDLLPLLKDGLRDTEWTTGRPKKKGDFISLTLDRPRAVDRIEILSPRLISDAAANVQVNASIDGRRWRVVGPGFSPGDYILDLVRRPRESAQVVRLGGRKVRYIKIILKVGDPKFSWCIPEVRVYAAEDRPGQ